MTPLPDEEKFMGFRELAGDHTGDIAAVPLALSHPSTPVLHEWPSASDGFHMLRNPSIFAQWQRCCMIGIPMSLLFMFLFAFVEVA